VNNAGTIPKVFLSRPATFRPQADVGVMVYVLAGSAAILIAMLTISYQSIRAARANPASSLRSE